MEIINRYTTFIDLIISEPDKGIYDAMNKSIKYCKGEWINFMNSGDIFNSHTTIDEVFKNIPFKNNEAIIYGKHKVAYVDTILFKTSNPITELWKGMTIQHQSIFIKKNILEKYPFNILYRFAADYDLIYNCYKRGFIINFIDIFISIVSSNGISVSNSVSTYSEFKKIALHYEGENERFLRYYKCTIFKRQIIGMIKSIFPIFDKIRLFFK